MPAMSAFVSSVPLSRRAHPPRIALRRPVLARMRMSASGDPIVPILMGSASDLPYCEKISSALTALGIKSEMRIASAHKIPARLMDVVQRYEADPRPKLYVAVAGRSNALSGMLDCAVSAPVISCPPPSDKFGGADLFSSIRMPSGVAPALVLEPGQAALFVAKSLGVYDKSIRDRVAALQKANRDRLYVDDAEQVSKTYRQLISNVRESKDVTTETDEKLIFGDTGVGTKIKQGKVRDQYVFRRSDDEFIALITTDRQSAFDRILAAIPYKGAVLNLTSAWWFRNTQHIIPNHLISSPHANVTIAKKCKPFPVEFVVRGYITGSTATSLWKNYSNGVRNYCGIEFEDGLEKNQKLRENVLTPTTKEDKGDRPISPREVVSEGLMTQADWDTCANAAMKLFEYGQAVASQNGLILVDTKYEFGKDEDGVIRLIDEIHTPDSSRYWLATSYQQRIAAGKEPENIDKELLRLWFTENCDPYDTSKELPDAPDELVDELSRRYIMLYELITGERFDFEGATVGADMIAECMQGFTGAVLAAAR